MKITINKNSRRSGLTVLTAIIVAAVVLTVGTIVVVKVINAFKRVDGQPTRGWNTNLIDDVYIPSGSTAQVQVVAQSFTFQWMEFPDVLADVASPPSSVQTVVSPLVMVRVDNLDNRVHLQMTTDKGWYHTNLGSLFELDADGLPVKFTPRAEVISMATGVPVIIMRSTNLVQWSDVATIYVVPSPPSAPLWIHFKDETAPPGSASYKARR